LHVDFAHVAYIEKSGRTTHGFVLFEDAPILNRHFPSGEVNQSSAVGCVKIAKRGAFEFAHTRETTRSSPAVCKSFRGSSIEDGIEETKKGFCLDQRKLAKISVPPNYPLQFGAVHIVVCCPNLICRLLRWSEAHHSFHRFACSILTLSRS